MGERRKQQRIERQSPFAACLRQTRDNLRRQSCLHGKGTILHAREMALPQCRRFRLIQTGGQRCSERLNIILPHPPLLICGVIQVPRFRLRRYRRCGVRTQQLMSKMLDGRGIRQHMMVNARQNGLLRLSPHQQHKARKLPFRHREGLLCQRPFLTFQLGPGNPFYFQCKLLRRQKNARHIAINRLTQQGLMP